MDVPIIAVLMGSGVEGSRCAGTEAMQSKCLVSASHRMSQHDRSNPKDFSQTSLAFVRVRANVCVW